MMSTATPIIAQVRQEFEALLAHVTGPETATCTAYEVERTIFQRLLALGAGLLRLFFLTRAAVRPAGPVLSPGGVQLAYHDRRPVTYYSVFGKVAFARHAFHACQSSPVNAQRSSAIAHSDRRQSCTRRPGRPPRPRATASPHLLSL